ncbi:MAG: sulfate ABC transporter permease subunit CysT [Holophaga sp.]|jgi:sulfate transport system permease protein
MARSRLPGFGLSLGLTLAWAGLLVLLPLAALVAKAAGAGTAHFGAVVRDPRVLAALRLSLLTALAAAGVNLVFGSLVAWVLVRYRFPSRGLLDALMDLPLALPTAVAGITLTQLYLPEGWIGRYLPFQVAFAPLGILLALVFIGLPLVVRTVQPALLELPPEEEEAAAMLGGSRLQVLVRVVLPHLRPALITGFALAFARGLGEYGSVVFISANLPFRTEILPILIVSRLEEYDYQGASVIACLLLVVAFALLSVLQLSHRRVGGGRRA